MLRLSWGRLHHLSVGSHSAEFGRGFDRGTLTARWYSRKLAIQSLPDAFFCSRRSADGLLSPPTYPRAIRHCDCLH